MATQPRRLRLAAATLLTSLALASCTAGPAQHMASLDLSPVTATVEAAQATGQAAVEAIEAEQARQAELQRIAEERAAAEKAERQRIAAEQAQRERQQRIAEERAAAEQAAKEQAEREQPQKAAAERAQRAPAKKTEPASQKASAPQEGRTSEPAPKKAGPMSVEQKKALFRQEMNRWGGAGVALVVDPSMTSKANGSYSIGHRKISMNPRIPVERIPWIAAHEMAHFHQDRLGGFSLEAFNAQASKANRIYGGSGYSGMDQQADCAAAQMLGGFPVRPSYTSNCAGQRGEAARMLLRGEPLR